MCEFLRPVLLLCESCLKLRGGEDWTSSKFHVICVMCSVCAPLEVLLFYILLFTFFMVLHGKEEEDAAIEKA